MQRSRSAILISGASGGLGKALVETFLTMTGIDHIIATDVREEILTTYKDDPKVIGLYMDVSSEKSIKEVHDQLRAMNISIKYLVNNAGITLFFPISESTEALLDKIVKVNTYGPILTVSVFLDDLIKNRGRVVQISSDSVKLPTLFHAYPSTKISLEAFSISMRQELGLFDIDLILIRPGGINTSLVGDIKYITNPVNDSKYKKPFNTFMKLANSNIGKMVEPEIVARLIKKAILTRNPKRIYSINKNYKISLMRRLPQRLIDHFVKKAAK